MAAESFRGFGAKGIVAGLLTLFLIVAVGSALWKFAGALFIAVAGYVFLKPLYNRFRKKGFGKTISGCATLAIAAILIGIPCLLMLQLLVGEAIQLLTPQTVSSGINNMGAQLSKLGINIPWVDENGKLTPEFSDFAMQGAGFVKNLVLGGMQSVGEIALDALIAIFAFYYLLVAEGSIYKVREYIPFSKGNIDAFSHEFQTVTYSGLVSTFLMAILQALPMTLVFIFFNVPGAVLLGLVAAILTCIPFTGIPFVWIPVALFEALSGNYPAAIGITVVGIVIAVLENFRPMLQGKLGQMHPMASLLGVVVGIPYFGLLGVFIGPILVSYALLSVKMFKKEYL